MSVNRQQLIQQFIEYRKASNRWNSSYEDNLRKFDESCSETYADDSLTQTMVDAWMKPKGRESHQSCNSRVQVIRTFLSYLRERNLTTIITPEALAAPPNQYIPHAFSDEELTQFFQKCDQQVREEIKPRDAVQSLLYSVIFRLLYSSGMRTCEARMLQPEDVDLQHGVINVRKTKTNIQHYVVLDDDVRIMLERFDLVAKSYFPDRNYFFPSRSNSYISVGALNWRFQKIWKQVSTERAVPYDLRHNYAIRNINSWIDVGFGFHDKLLHLSKSMGHTNLEATKYYYSLVPALADTISRKSGKGFDEIVPEVRKNG